MTKYKLYIPLLIAIIAIIAVSIFIFPIEDNGNRNDGNADNNNISNNDDNNNISNNDITYHNSTNNNDNGDDIVSGTSEYNNHVHGKIGRIFSNAWGATEEEIHDKTLKLYVYSESDGGFGWKWDRPDPRPDPSIYISPVYPEIVIGRLSNEYLRYGDYFPIRYGDINDWSTEIEFTLPKKPTGKYNLAYDTYWMDGDIKKFNVMIWIRGHHDEEPIGTASDGINEYIHYYRPAGSGQYWEWHAFELKDQSKNYYKINIKKLIESLDIDNDWIIPGIELGSEIWRGSGEIEVAKYKIVLNEHTIE